MGQNEIGQFLLAVFVLTPLVWVLVLWLISRLGGWASLAARYPAVDVPATGEAVRWQSLSLNRIASYNNCVNITLDESGMTLVPSLAFRLGHAPLRIPWSAVAKCQRQKWWWRQVTFLTLRDGGENEIGLYGKAGEKVAQRLNST